MGEALEGARVAVRCDNPYIQRESAAGGAGIAKLACCLGNGVPISQVSGRMNRRALRAARLVIDQDLLRSAPIRVVATAIVDAFRRHSRTLRRRVTE